MAMSDKFKAVSDAMRKALQALGETPEQHPQEQKERLLNSSSSKGFSLEKTIGLIPNPRWYREVYTNNLFSVYVKTTGSNVVATR